VVKAGAKACPTSEAWEASESSAATEDCTTIVSVGAASDSPAVDTNSGGISKEFDISTSYSHDVTPLIEKILGDKPFDKDTSVTLDGSHQ
jgi:hypothetical protein